ncbi:hypothetical protein D3C81_1600560 [compost metagenome]
MANFAPTSMPRVGSSKKMIFDSRYSHLLMTIFCWLPPERLRAICFEVGVLMPSAAMYCCATASSLAKSMKPKRFASPDTFVRVRLAATDMRIARPWLLRSSDR